MPTPTKNQVSCSNCGGSFKVPSDRKSGFSHCANHNHNAELSTKLTLSLDECESLVVELYNEQLVYTITHQDPSEPPVALESLEEVIAYQFPFNNLRQRVADEVRLKSGILKWLIDHEANSRKKEFVNVR